MIKKANVYIVITVITLVLLMAVQYSRPKEINWFPSYAAQHKIPYGTYVLNELMPKLFPNAVEQVHLPPFEFLERNSDAQGTYFMVNGSIDLGKAELNALLEWTHSGNTLFIASRSFEKALLDTLNLKTAGLFADLGEKHQQVYALVNPVFGTEASYSFERDDYINYFDSIDTLSTTVIGIVDSYNEEAKVEEEHTNVIQQNFGQGQILLSTFPKAFTNYFILKDDHKNYTAGLLSYIDGTRPIYMDNHHKSGKTFYSSPMYLFLNTKELKWAYYIALIGVVLYLLFEGKRKQRAIPVIPPLKNQTLAFTRTIADMYYEKGRRKTISNHIIMQFYDYLRTRFYMATAERDAAFYENLASRSAHSITEIKALFAYFEALQNKSQVSDDELKKLNGKIEKFKHKVDGK